MFEQWAYGRAAGPWPVWTQRPAMVFRALTEEGIPSIFKRWQVVTALALVVSGSVAMPALGAPPTGRDLERGTLAFTLRASILHQGVSAL